MNITEQIKVMQAFKDGAEIEARGRTGTRWAKASTPSWNWHCTEYRIKEKPKTVTLYYYRNVNGSLDGLVNIFDREMALHGWELVKTETIEVSE
jgi:hypothetical protein